MTGKTHYKLGIMYYVIFSLLPFAIAVPYLKGNGRLTLASIGAAALGALIVDSDTDRSLISQMNPVTAGAEKVTTLLERIFNKVLRFVICLTLGYLMITNISKLTGFTGNSGVSRVVIFFIAMLIILAGFMSESFMLRLPIIGAIYYLAASAIRSALNLLRRALVFIVYVGAAVAISVYSFNNGNQIILYIIAAVLLGTAVFPHRTFLHSIEGFLMYSAIAVYVFRRLGFADLSQAFIIGYFSHLYLADIFTNTGVPISVLPTVLRKTGVHAKLSKSSIYRLVYKVLNTRLTVPIVNTGTSSGNVFEYIYTSVMLIAAVVLVSNNYNNIIFSLF